MLLNFLFEGQDPCRIELRGRNRTKEKEEQIVRRIYDARQLEAVYSSADTLKNLGYDVYFGVACRRPGSLSGTKADFSSSRTVWADIDCGYQEFSEQIMLPPSCVVNSGRNVHAYWYLQERIFDVNRLETMNKLVASALVPRSACWDCSHVLRVPGTLNFKNPENPLPVETIYEYPDRLYTETDFAGMSRMSRSRFIVENIWKAPEVGERSEVEFKFIGSLMDLGLSDNAIAAVMMNFPVGAKTQDPDTPSGYFVHTLQQLRQRKKNTLESITLLPQGIQQPEPEPQEVEATVEAVETADLSTEEIFEGTGAKLYKMTTKGELRTVTTFAFRNVRLIEWLEQGADGEKAPDSFSVDIVVELAPKKLWSDTILLRREDFESATKFKKALYRGAWSFFGNDVDVQKINDHLIRTWRKNRGAKVLMTRRAGRTTIVKNGHAYDFFASDTGVFDATGPRTDIEFTTTTDKEAGVAYSLSDQNEAHDVGMDRQILAALFSMNQQSTIVPFLGWWFATPFKQILRSGGYKFPILQVYGTRGAGKTSTIQLLGHLFGISMMPLPASSSDFIVISRGSQSDTVPACWTEYREYLANQGHRSKNFLERCRNNYDGTPEQRGRSDLRTVEFLTTAPFCVDGEEMFSDSALKERILPAYFNVNKLDALARKAEAFLTESKVDLPRLGTRYLLNTLQVNPIALYEKAYTFFSDSGLPPRIQHNCAIGVVGLMSLEKFCNNVLGCRLPCGDVNRSNVLLWFQGIFAELLPKGNRTDLRIDHFILQIVNAIIMQEGNLHRSSFSLPFAYHWVSSKPHLVGFALSGAHAWYVGKTPVGESPMALDTVRRQLQELTAGSDNSYVVRTSGATSITNMPSTGGKAAASMVLIDLEKARDAGLEILMPESSPITESISLRQISTT